jgi:uncharacterized protein
MAENVYIYELKRVDLKGATVIDGFPSVGLVSSIVANYIINSLHLELVGIMDSIYFPTVSLIRDGTPTNPVRIYSGAKKGGDEDQIAVFISEFQPPPNLIKLIAHSLNEELVSVYGIGSTPFASDVLKNNSIKIFEEGVITGVAGVLLNEGKKRDFDVISLLSEAHPDYPDARAAARVIDAIDKILLHTELDAKPLYEEAERIEMQLKAIHKQATTKKPPTPSRPSMYG